MRILRWRLGQRGAYDPIRFLGSPHWSLDNHTWKNLPQAGQIYASAQRVYTGSELPIAEIMELVRNGKNEPVSYELFLEASNLTDSNPRGALILAIVALETSVKQYISTIVSHTQWLVEHLPSPPVLDILRDYIPLLPAVLTFNGKVFPPPKRILDTLKKGIQIRNSLIHTGNATIRRDFLQELLECVRDAIWLLEYYRGNQWALKYLNYETYKELETQSET